MVAGKTMTIVGITLLMCIIDQAVGINCKCAPGAPLYNDLYGFYLGCVDCDSDCGNSVTNACYACCTCCCTDSNAAYYVTNYGTETSGFEIEGGGSCPQVTTATTITTITPGGHGGD